MKIVQKRRASIAGLELLKLQKLCGSLVSKTKRSKKSRRSTAANTPTEKVKNEIKVKKGGKKTTQKKTFIPEVIYEIVELKHKPEFYKGSSEKSIRMKGFLTPDKKGVLKQVNPYRGKSKVRDTNPLKEMADNIKLISPAQEDKTTVMSEFVPRGNFESGNKANKILRSVLIEGKVLFDIEWKRETDRIQPLNTLVSEDTLKKNLKPRTFKKLLNQYLAEDSPN